MLKLHESFLKIFVQGKLLFCQSPPNVQQNDFAPMSLEITEDLSLKKAIEDVDDLDIRESFPELTRNLGVHLRGTEQKAKKVKRKKEKARRMYTENPYANY